MNTPAEQITPGYEWFEIPRERLSALDPSQGIEPVDLHEQYPIVDGEALQATWDRKDIRTEVLDNGVILTSTTFNPGADEGSTLWLPGWGVSNLRGGGAAVATAMAALNPNRKVITAEELERVPDAQMEAAVAGDMSSYADNYRGLIGEDVDTLSGHSRGGVIQAHLAGHNDVEGIKTISLMDVPRARGYLTAFGFGARVGYFDNQIQGKYAHLSDQDEETLLKDTIDDGVAKNGSTLEALLLARKQWWLVRSMAQVGLQKTLETAIDNNPEAHTFLWHGTKNVGAPVASTRAIVRAVRCKLDPEQQTRLHYFESPTGHFAEGHTGRYARQTAYAVDHSE